MSELEKLQIQYNHAKKVQDKEKMKQLQEQIEKLPPQKLKLDCCTCKNRIEKVLNNGFRDYQGFYCTKLESELTIDTPIPKITDYNELFKSESKPILSITESSTFTRHFKHGNYLDTQFVHDCSAHSNNPQKIETKPIITKKFHDYPLLFKFSRNFTKLESDRFTTIRSTHFNADCKDAPNFQKGTIGRYSVNGSVAPYLIQVRDWVDKRIEEFELSTLQKDIHPFSCNSKEEFVRQLNDLYKSMNYNSNTLITTQKRLFIIKKVTNLDEIQANQNN